MRNISTPTKLFAIWLFILLNVVFRDIHQFTMKSHLEMLLTGIYNGTPVTDVLMLIGGFVVEVLLLLMILSLFLKRKYNRPMNFIGLILATGILMFEPPSDMDDIFFKIIEMISLLSILYINWRWKEDEKEIVI